MLFYIGSHPGAMEDDINLGQNGQPSHKITQPLALCHHAQKVSVLCVLFPDLLLL